MCNLERLRIESDVIEYLERGVMGEQGVYPDWVYAARDALKHQNDNIPWLPDLLAALCWQGGTIHQALNAVRRLVVASGTVQELHMTSCLKYHGGKQTIAPWIRSHFKPHTHYVEPYCGAAAVLLSCDGVGVSEVINDVDGNVAAFWRSVSSRYWFADFHRRVSLLPVSASQFQEYRDILNSDAINFIERAAAFFYVARCSYAGRQQTFHPTSKTRTRRGMNEQVSAYLSAVEGLPQLAERMQRVLLFNEPALNVIRREDSPTTLHYVDPPYMPGSRAEPNAYRHEMSEADHAALLDTLNRCKGQVFLSGYRSELYDAKLQGWTRHELDVANHAADGGNKRRMTECLWEKPR